MDTFFLLVFTGLLLAALVPVDLVFEVFFVDTFFVFRAIEMTPKYHVSARSSIKTKGTGAVNSAINYELVGWRRQKG